MSWERLNRRSWPTFCALHYSAYLYHVAPLGTWFFRGSHSWYLFMQICFCCSYLHLGVAKLRSFGLHIASPQRENRFPFLKFLKKALAKSYFPQGNFLFFLFHTSLTKDVDVMRWSILLSVGSLTSRFLTTAPLTLWQDEDLSRRIEEWAVLYLDTKVHVCSCSSVLKVRSVIPKNHSIYWLQLFSLFHGFYCRRVKETWTFCSFFKQLLGKGHLDQT